MKIGYARVSTGEQTLDLQRDALRKAGCEKVFEEQGISGSIPYEEREQASAMMDFARQGDTVVAWSVDRLARNLRNLLELLDELRGRQIGLLLISAGLHLRFDESDISDPATLMMVQMLGMFAEFERNRTQERTQAGLRAARARGRMGGRPKALSPERVEMARQLHAAGTLTIAQICQQLECSRTTLYRALAERKQEEQQKPHEEEKTQ